MNDGNFLEGEDNVQSKNISDRMANVPAGITVNDDLYSSVSTERESR